MPRGVVFPHVISLTPSSSLFPKLYWVSFALHFEAAGYTAARAFNYTKVNKCHATMTQYLTSLSL